MSSEDWDTQVRIGKKYSGGGGGGGGKGADAGGPPEKKAKSPNARSGPDYQYLSAVANSDDTTPQKKISKDVAQTIKNSLQSKGGLDAVAKDSGVKGNDLHDMINEKSAPLTQSQQIALERALGVYLSQSKLGEPKEAKPTKREAAIAKRKAAEEAKDAAK